MERKKPTETYSMNRRTAVAIGWLLSLGAVPLTAACQSAPAVVPVPAESAPKAEPGVDRRDEIRVPIHVVSNGWHTGIVVARAALPVGAVPEATDFPDAPYLEFGWGDAEYYPAPSPTLGMAVVHLVGLPAHPRDVFPTAEVVELRLSPAGFQRLVDYLDDTFARGDAERAQASAPGLYRFSLFYPAKGEFHLFNTCNTWTARALEAAGWPVQVSGTLRAEDLMAQIRGVGTGKHSAPSRPD
jgi:uncharacterized protein (TIGR02117 family)